MKRVIIISGGTINPIMPHLSVCSKAGGMTGRHLERLCREAFSRYRVTLHETFMANPQSGRQLVSNADVEKLVSDSVQDRTTKIMFMPVAICDYVDVAPSDARIDSRENPTITVQLEAAPKILPNIRKVRKGIFLVGFSQSSGATEVEMYRKGLRLLKTSSANLVLANDSITKLNMIIVPEEAAYCITVDRGHALRTLVEMVALRSSLTYTRSDVVPGELVKWSSDEVPETLRKVVDHCIKRGAYKPFLGVTTGHFAAKVRDGEFLTSRRKTDFNQIHHAGLVRVLATGEDTVTAIGGKPSVGGQSQRIIFDTYPSADCIVHFHCPPKPGVSVPVADQFPFECGSHQCGSNTALGLREIGFNIRAVYLQNHGPNIVFARNTDPEEVIDYIENHFDLEGSTSLIGGK